MRNADLHTHSYYSDGQISPKNLVRLAKRRGIKTLALTDHNSVKGVKEAFKEGRKIGVRVIPAVEVRVDKGEVLGYFIDIDNKELIKEMKKSSKSVEARIKDRCKKLKEANYDLSFQDLRKKYPKARGNINEFYVLYELYLRGYGNMMDIADKLSEQAIKKKKVKEIPILKAIKLIKKAGGVPILAHPWIDDEVLKEKNIKKCIKAGLKGLEINNGDRLPLRTAKHIKRIKNIAKRYKLILTSGSDFHGIPTLVRQMPGNHNLGKNNCDESVVKKLENAKLETV
jgi:predicted metal-dependent phosphoesterase TrpH